MRPPLPTPISKYFEAKNAHDVDAMLTVFSERASVHDEGRDMVGRPAIRAWMEETSRKYRVTVAPTAIDRPEAQSIVTATVSGTFPGSPIQLRFRFTIVGDEITHLEIG